MNNLSENLKKIRKDNNLSQEDLANELGVSRQSISKWESGLAYPEMEKLIQICQKFELNIDDLINNDIREVKREEEGKNNINKYIEDSLHFITDTVDLFLSMTFKTKIKFILEELIILAIITIFLNVIGDIGTSIFSSIFFNVIPTKLYEFIYGVLYGIYSVFSFIITLIIIVHIFKTRYLDYYKKIKNNKNDVLEKQEDKNDNKEEKNDNKEDKNDNKEELKNNKESNSREKLDDKEDINNKILLNKNEDKIIIRDPKHSEYRFINGIFKIIIIFIKFFALLVSTGFIAMLIGFLICTVLSFVLFQTGIFFIGLFLTMISLSLSTIIILSIIFNFIFNRKNNKKRIIWIFIISIIMFGVGCGSIALGSLNFNIVEDNKELFVTKTKEIDMRDNLVIDNIYNIKYVEKDIENIIIEYSTFDYCELEYQKYKANDLTEVYFWNKCTNKMEIVRKVIKELNNYNITIINDEYDNMTLYASKENIQKLKDNRQKYEERYR